MIKLYKYKIFNIGYCRYELVNGKDTWFSKKEVAEAFNSLPNQRWYEVHRIELTTVCRLEE